MLDIVIVAESHSPVAALLHSKSKVLLSPINDQVPVKVIPLIVASTVLKSPVCVSVIVIVLLYKTLSQRFRHLARQIPHRRGEARLGPDRHEVGLAPTVFGALRRTAALDPVAARP